MAIRIIYTFLIGIFLSIFVGVGIAAFYPAPKFPDQPVNLKYCSPEIVKDAKQYSEFKRQADNFDKAEKKFQEDNQIYARNVSIIAIIGAIIITVSSLTLFRSLQVIADGMLLGGVLTLIYSVMRGFEAQDNMFRFIVVSIGLFISLFLGYIKFIKPQEKKHKH